MVKKIVAGCLAAGILGGIAYYSGYLYSSRQLPIENPGAQARKMDSPGEAPKPSLPDMNMESGAEMRLETGAEAARAKAEEDGEKQQEEVSYYLIEEFGYVNIYLEDRETLYEHTNIAIGLLPEELQQEICLGKAVAGEQELYDFLENYSS